MTEIRVGQTTLSVDAEGDEVRASQLLAIVDAEGDEVRVSQLLVIVDGYASTDPHGPPIQVI